MFKINEDNSIHVTRGDILFFTVTATVDGNPHQFKAGDVLRITVFGKKDAEKILMQKDFPILADKNEVEVYLGKDDTKIGEPVSKPTDFWYEIELNPETEPQTIVGYDEDGPKIFRIYPEGCEVG